MLVVQRRARPLLGTLVEIGLPEFADAALFEIGFAELEQVQARLSRFEADSDVGRFHALAVGDSVALNGLSARVLHAAAWLRLHSGGLFDISQGTGPQGWQLRGGRLLKTEAGVRLDLGGIAKGYAVDRASAALRRAGCGWACVNAGGDLRVFGAHAVPLRLRDELRGGVRELGELAHGSFATSHFTANSRSALHAPANAGRVHVSVAAPRCLWADALTKIVAASGDAGHPLLTRLGAQAWLH